MLQQTRVEAVVPYYRRFLRRFPNLRALARATEPEVMSLWSGLGYYRRARMLLQAAQRLVREHHGRWPRTAESLQTLPGIGRYTASAIASICFDEETAVVDGNVERVLTRLHGRKLPLTQQWKQANALLAPDRPGDFNQAMMELGATVCTPLSPSCNACPIRRFCVQRGPVQSNGPRRPKLKRNVAFALDYRPQRIRLVQRAASARLMPSMWELPPATSPNGNPILQLKHTITNTEYGVSIYSQKARHGRFIPLTAALRLPLTGLARKVIRRALLE